MGLPAAEILAKPFTPRQCVCGNGKVYTSQEALNGHYRHSPSCNPKNRPAAPLPLQLHQLVRFSEQPASQLASQPASQGLAGSWVPDAFIEPAQPATFQPLAGSQLSPDWQLNQQIAALNAALNGFATLPVQVANIEQRLNQQLVQQPSKAAAKPLTWVEGFFAWWRTLNTPQQIGLVLFGGFVTWQIALAWSRSTAPAKAASGGFLGGVGTYAAKKAVDRFFR